ncbi:MAG: hypothetical protein QM765_52190 [Myxococcales bacterium]
MILAALTLLLSAAAGGWLLDRRAPQLGAGLVVGGACIAVIQLALDLVGAGSAGLTVAFAALLVPGVLGLVARARSLRGAAFPKPAFALAVGVTLFAALLLLSGPLTDWDARMIWAHKAQLFVRDRSVLADSFTDPYRLHIHPRYPVLVSLQTALATVAAGGWDERAYQLLIAAAGVATVWQMARLAGPAAALTWACTGGWFLAIARASVEVYLTLATLVAAVAAIDWLRRGGTAEAVRLGLAVGGLLLVKNEGLVLALSLGLALLATSWHRTGRERLRLALSAAIALAFLAPWLLVRARLPMVSDAYYTLRLADPAALAAGLKRLPEIFAALASVLFHWGHWHLVWWSLPALAFGAARVADREARLLLLFAAAYGGAVLAVFVASPYHSVGSHVNVTADRVLLPAAALLVAAGWRLHAAWASARPPAAAQASEPAAGS